MSIMVGVGRGARAGILVRDAQALEAFERVDTIVIDKTGTLTEGRPKLASVVTAPDVDENTLLRLAATVEQASEHPLARAIIEATKARGLPLDQVSNFVAYPGKGATGSIGGKSVALGNAALMRDLNI